MRVTVLPPEQPAGDDRADLRPANGPSTAESLVKYVGTWEGDDIEECLDLVYATRSKTRF